MTRSYRLSPEANLAWVDWDPGYDPDPPLTAKQSNFVRDAFMSGWIAATEAAVAIAIKWRDENQTAAFAARKRGRNRYDFDGDQTQLVMAEQLDGAAIECNAIAQALRELASAIEARSDATTQIDAAEGESAAPKADAQ